MLRAEGCEDSESHSAIVTQMNAFKRHTQVATATSMESWTGNNDKSSSAPKRSTRTRAGVSGSCATYGATLLHVALGCTAQRPH